MIRNAICAVVFMLALPPSPGAVFAQEQKAADERTLSIDVKDTDIRDVVRTISTGYNLSIIMDKDVGGRVSVHLAGVPIMEGLQKLVSTLGLEVVKEGSVYSIRKKTDEQRSVLQYVRVKLTVDVQNMDVKDFIKEISSKTAVSIVPDSKVAGTISGKLYQVSLEDGLRALLEGNGLKVVKWKNIFRVQSDAGGGAGPEPSPMRGMRGSSGRSSFRVDYQNGNVTLDVSNGELEDVIKALAEQSELQVVTYGSIRAEINAKLENIPLTEALALLLGGTNYTFIQKDSIILIGDRNPASPSGQALSKSELVHLNHIKADNVPQILPKDIQVTNIKVVKEQNALLVSGTSEDIVNTRDFLTTIDIPTPQVVIDVLVVEYSREVDKNHGIELGWGQKVTNSASFPNLQASGDGTWADYALTTMKFPAGTAKNLGLLTNDFYVKLRLLETENKAKVLAQPSITVLNGNKAQINVGQSQYFKITSGTSDNPTYQFRPINFGINLQITPWISKSGQITAEINPDISNAMGINKDGYPNVFTRSVSTTVRLDNGETLVLGGLIRTDINETSDKVPILGDLPLIGALFRTTQKTNTQTNLVIYITPHIAKDSGGVNLANELKNLDKQQRRIYLGDESFLEGYKRASSGRRAVRPDSAAKALIVKDSATSRIVGADDSLVSNTGAVAPAAATKDTTVRAAPQAGDTLSKAKNQPQMRTVAPPVRRGRGQP